MHGAWDDGDESFLAAAAADLVLFVGDFGDEDVGLVTRIARLRVPKLVMLGNHEAWWGMRRGSGGGRIRAQIDALGGDFAAYRERALAGGRLAVVGARPFSWGGGWSRHAGFYHDLFGVRDNQGSAERMVEAAARVPAAELVLLGHNGPRGLGARADAIFGCDFREPHGDWGDADQSLALDQLRSAGRRVVATVAGHMHEALKGGGSRCRAVRAAGTLHVNAAVVPRHRGSGQARLRHFLELRIAAGEPVAADLWVDDRAEVRARRVLDPVEVGPPAGGVDPVRSAPGGILP